MANQEVTKKLQALAGKVQGRITRSDEDRRLEQVVNAKQPKTRDDVKEVLAEALQTDVRSVSTVLASHDDSDRLIDDIINELKK